MTRDLSTSHARRLLRLAVAWLMAIVLPLQGLSAVAAVAAGPLHTHLSRVDVPVLLDLRRAFAAPSRALPVAASESISEWQHAANHLLPQRHVHAASDATVVDQPDPLSTKESGKADMQSALFIAIVHSVVGWQASVGPSDMTPLALWSPTAASIGSFERPPRQG